MKRRVFKWSKRILILLIGLPVIAIGIVLIPLPGPGLLVIIAGLAILALEFDFARNWMEQAKQKLEETTAAARKRIEDLRHDDSNKK